MEEMAILKVNVPMVLVTLDAALLRHGDIHRAAGMIRYLDRRCLTTSKLA